MPMNISENFSLVAELIVLPDKGVLRVRTKYTTSIPCIRTLWLALNIPLEEITTIENIRYQVRKQHLWYLNAKTETRLCSAILSIISRGIRYKKLLMLPKLLLVYRLEPFLHLFTSTAPQKSLASSVTKTSLPASISKSGQTSLASSSQSMKNVSIG